MAESNDDWQLREANVCWLDQRILADMSALGGS
jgi:hypothetical protein